METKRIYAALGLCILFVFPVLYRPLHVFLHHHESFPASAVCGESCAETRIAKYGKEDCSENNLSVKKNNCPVCNYEFAVFSIVTSQACKTGETSHSEFTFIFIGEKIIAFSGQNISLRAPPA
ncbi:MAG: hypothetical protein JXA03_13260 [Bacteroidales bacterium]|nr:hypothetical protein [Bacteroidales bacterium]